MLRLVRKPRGFTLLEVMIVIGITIVLGASTLLFFTKIQNVGDTSSAKQELIQNLRLAQSKAIAGENDSSFGIYIQNSQYTLYRGNDYATRASTEDQLFTLPQNLSVSTTLDMHFAKKTGTPSSATTLTTVDDVTGNSETITINALGQMY